MNPESMLLAVDHFSTTLWIMILSRQYGGELKGPNQKPCCGLCSDPGMSLLPDSTFTLLLGFCCHWKRVFMVFMLVSQIHQPLPIFCLQTEFQGWSQELSLSVCPVVTFCTNLYLSIYVVQDSLFFGFAFINNIAFNNRNNLITDTSALFIKEKLGQ